MDHNVIPKAGLIRIGIPDQFIDTYGPQSEIMNKFRHKRGRSCCAH